MGDVHSIYRVISDTRFASSLAFAAEAERLGAHVVRIQGDITDFWFHDLSRVWKSQPLAVAGLTAHGPIFCLERFAWDHGLRVVYRGTHRTNEGGEVEHTLSGPSATIARARAVSLEGQEWARGVAHLVSACAIESTAPDTLAIPSSVSRRSDESHEPLISWVIAPRHRL